MTKSLPQKLLEVQKKIGAVTKSSSNPHFRSKYADLNEVLDVAKEALNNEGIFIAQSPGANEFGKYLETSLINADDGQQIQGRVYFSGAEENMQKIGAAITYARRFGLVSLLALESEDDDGESAVGRGQAKVAASESKDSASVGVKSNKLGGVREEPRPAVPTGVFNRKNCLEKISLTSKVLIDSKRATQEEVLSMLKAYNVDNKEKLSDFHASDLLSQLEERLNK